MALDFAVPTGGAHFRFMALQPGGEMGRLGASYPVLLNTLHDCVEVNTLKILVNCIHKKN